MPYSQRVGDICVRTTLVRIQLVSLRAFSDANISVLPWPAMSSDLNPVVHLWDQLKLSLKEIHSQVNSQHDLINALKLCWQQIPDQNITHLIESFSIGSDSAYEAKEVLLDAKGKFPAKKQVDNFFYWQLPSTHFSKGYLCLIWSN